MHNTFPFPCTTSLFWYNTKLEGRGAAWATAGLPYNASQVCGKISAQNHGLTRLMDAINVQVNVSTLLPSFGKYLYNILSPRWLLCHTECFFYYLRTRLSLAILYIKGKAILNSKKEKQRTQFYVSTHV